MTLFLGWQSPRGRVPDERRPTTDDRQSVVGGRPSLVTPAASHRSGTGAHGGTATNPFISIAIPLALTAAYLVTRLANLGALPMVSDEGTYLTWGVRALYARSVDDWLAALEDGKQPLLAWLMPPFLAAVPDRLIAGRLVSVFTGLANLFLVGLLGRRLYGRAAGRVAAALYVVAPIALVHDRMALYDSLVTTTALLVLLAALAWAERPDARRTGLLGIAMGLAVLTKLSALFFVALAPAAIALWRRDTLHRWWLLAQAYFVAAAAYSVLYLSPLVGNIAEGNFQRYSLTAGDVLRFPIALWLKNALFVVEAAAIYLGWPLAALAAAALLGGAALGGRPGRVVALWVLVPLVLFVLTAKLIYSRYLVFCFVVALLPAAHALARLPGWLSGGPHDRRPTTAGRAVIRRRSSRPLGPAAGPGALVVGRPLVVGLAGAAVAAPGVLFGGRLLVDPASAPWMNDQRYITDRFQYVESNYAGYGLREIVDFLRARAAEQPIVVLARNTTGMPRDGVTAYLLEWPNVHVGFVPENEGIEARLLREPDRTYQFAAQGAELYYVLSDAPGGEQEQRFRGLNPGLVPLIEIAKPGNHSRFQLYKTRLTPPSGETWLEPPPRLGGQITLRGYRLSSPTARPGQSLRLVLYWEAQARVGKNYTVFNHVAEAGGPIWGQRDGQPVGGHYPTSRWRARELVADVHDVAIKPDAPPGTYDLLTGLYELQTLYRLPVEREGLPAADCVVLARITVLAP
jgi:hypothetical protein